MAIKNSIEQLMIPGLADLIKTEVADAITSNATLGAIEQNLQSAGSITEIKDAIESIGESGAAIAGTNPYPTFAFWDNEGNNPYFSIYDSNFSHISTGRTDTNSEMHSSNTGRNYTNGSISSNSSGSTNSIQGCNWSQADGHAVVAINEGYTNSTGVNSSSFMGQMRYYGVVIGTEGKRQPISIYLSGDNLGIGPRGHGRTFDYITNLNSSTYSEWQNRTSYGMVAYNERTSTLVAMEGDSSNNYRMHIWKHTGRNLNDENYKTGTLHLFLSEAKSGTSTVEGSILSYQSYEFQWNSSSSSSYNESRYRMRIIPGDNGVIGMARMVPSNRTEYATFNPGDQSLDTNYTTMSLTTSYGVDNGSEYGMRHQINWANDIVACYNPYYYYHSGFVCYFIDVKDPRNYARGTYNETSWGCQLVPFGKNKFLFHRTNSNADGGSGFQPATVDPAGVFKNDRAYSGSAGNGASISLTALTESQRFSNRYTSTLYPVMLPVPHWKIAN